MAAPLPTSRYQYCDANGVPLAGGTIATYVYGTSTPKNTWADQNESALNTNPVVLDASGRCSMFGDGEYRLVLHDADGNLIWDVYATTIVSAAMQPVVDAATLAAARTAMGIDSAIAAAVAVETTRAEAAEATLQTHIDTTNTNLANAETTINAAIAAETAARIAADANLQSQINAGSGSNFAEANTSMTAITSVSITTHGRAVKVTVIGSPGIDVDSSGNTTSATGKITRDGITIGMMGFNSSGGAFPEAPSCIVVYQAPTVGVPPAILQPFYPTNPVIPLDRPAAGSHTYQVEYYVDPLIFPPIDWTTIFGPGAWCYLLVEEM